MITKKIDNYIFKTVLYSFLIVSVIFCVLFFIFTYLAHISGSDNVDGVDALIETIFQLPGILYILMPACAMVGSLMGLGMLANNSEIIILRASGFSTARIAKGVIGVGLLITIVTVLLGGYIAPYLERISEQNKLYTSNLWLKSEGNIVNIKSINYDKSEAYGIRKFIIQNGELDEVRAAKKATYTSDKAATVHDISKIAFSNEPKKDLKVTTLIKYDDWSDPLALSIAKIVSLDKNEYLNLNQLYKFVTSKRSNSDDGSIALKFWQEVFQPFSLIILMLISVPLSIGSTRSSSMILKLLFGAFIGFLFFIANQIFGPMALMLRLPPIIGAMTPTIIAFILLIILFIKAKE